MNIELKNVSNEMILNSGFPEDKMRKILANPETNAFRKAANLLRRTYNEAEKNQYKEKYYGKIIIPTGEILHNLDDAEEIKKYAYLIFAKLEEEISRLEDHSGVTVNLPKKDLSNFLGKSLSATIKNNDEIKTDSTGMKYISKFMLDLIMNTAIKRNSKGTLDTIKENPLKVWKWIFNCVEFYQSDDIDLQEIIRVSKMVGGNPITNFRPMAAAWLYNEFSDKSGDSIVIRDPSAGWMSRLSASFKLALMYPNKKVIYIATDPNPDLVAKKDTMVNTLKKMAGFGYNNNFEAHLFSHGSEIPEARFSDRFGKMSVIGTSPPYGDTESYNNLDVSILHPSQYKEKFLLPTLANFKYDLAENGLIWWNIAHSMASYPNLKEDTLSAFDEAGFELIKTIKYMVPRTPVMRKVNKIDHEPVFIFKHRVKTKK